MLARSSFNAYPPGAASATDNALELVAYSAIATPCVLHPTQGGTR
jgi:hypothetical protein